MSRSTVVVVEDEPLIKLGATALFAEAGIDVVEFADGDAALDYVRDHREDVGAVLTDVYLPGETDGLELANIVSEACPEIAVLVTSANRRVRPDALGRGVRCLPKPWSPDAVLATMREALRAAA